MHLPSAKKAGGNIVTDSVRPRTLKRVERVTRTRPKRRGGLVLEPVPGAYSMIPVCTPAECIEALIEALSRPEVDQLRRSMRRYSPATILAVAEQYAAAADFSTGRGVALSHATVADAIGRAAGTVKKICKFLTRLGFVVEVARGRNLLNLEELAQARAKGATNQRAVASVRALTIPRKYFCTPLPATKPVIPNSYVPKNSPRRAHARKSPATRAPLMRNESPRPLDLQRFAARLVDGDERSEVRSRRPLRWLLKTRHNPAHIGALADILTECGIDPARWSPGELIDEVDRWSVSHARTAIGDVAAHPLRYFRWILTQAIPPGTLSPAERRAHAEQTRRAARDERERQRQREQERMAKVDQAEIQRIIDQMHADQAARRLAPVDRTPYLPPHITPRP